MSRPVTVPPIPPPTGELAPLAAWAYSQRQGPGSGDTRWPVHLASVAWAERVLRANFDRSGGSPA